TPWRLVRTLLRREGPWGLVWRAVKRLGYCRAWWFVRQVDQPWHAALPAGFTLRILQPGDLEAYQRFRPGTQAQDYLGYLSQGHRGYAVWTRSGIAAATWVGRDRVMSRTLGQALAFEPDEWYLFDAYTRPEYRGRRLQAAILTAILRDAISARQRRLLLLIEPHNRPSLASRLRCGFERAGWVRQIRLGPWRWTFIRGPDRQPHPRCPAGGAGQEAPRRPG
ncbi:MAG TPA: GNAT family N-acetyltransferase, partial [Phycisphaeraceae bacterium]